MQRAVEFRLCDTSTLVREAAVDLIGRFVLNRPELTSQYYEMIADRIRVRDYCSVAYPPFVPLSFSPSLSSLPLPCHPPFVCHSIPLSFNLPFLISFLPCSLPASLTPLPPSFPPSLPSLPHSPLHSLPSLPHFLPSQSFPFTTGFWCQCKEACYQNPEGHLCDATGLP